MFDFTVENKYGEKLTLTGNENYVIKSIDGIDPADASFGMTKSAGADGADVNSASVNTKKITITLAINAPAEENRIRLYQFFMSKEAIRLYYKNGQRNVYIDGYVQTMPIGFFEKKQVVQIGVLCPNPFFEAKADKIEEFSSVRKMFEFPFEIEEPIPFSEFEEFIERNVVNSGDVETGAIFELHAKGEVVNPTIYLTDTNKFFGVNITMKAGDSIIIDTRKRNKKVVLVRDGITTNIIGKMKDGSSWLVLRAGGNLISTTVEQSPELLVATVEMTNKYGGV